jgi:L-threonylcarbamoyladenylate synthase
MPRTTSLNKELMERAAALIRAGRLVAFPTETVYGLGANALDAAAVARIFEAKQRPRSSPLIVHVASLEMARKLASRWPEQAEALARRFWPGPLTLVLPKQASIPDVVTAGLPTAGLRMPAHPVALELIRSAGVPVAAPSANRFMGLSPTSAAHVSEGLGAAVDLILDGGPAQVGIESTVLSLAEAVPVLLRPGMLSREQVEAVIGPIQIAGRVESGAAHPSPGMHDRHYSPRTPLLIVRGGALPARGRGALLSSKPSPGRGLQTVLMPADAAAYGSVLYETLHRLDGEGLDWIAVEEPPAGGAWDGIRDRLSRAASS